ncbi:MAG: hypothetical protein AAF289_02600 [Cyanobacteria bacterium P01_A01_bin.135]
MAQENGDPSLDANRLETAKAELNSIVDMAQSMAQDRKGDILELLALLRTLEACHKDIRDGLFQDAFPTNRQRLYRLLRDIESQGGWPYIPRMKIQHLLRRVESLQTEPARSKDTPQP